MLDLKKLAEHPAEYQRLLRTRSPDIDLSPLVEVYSESIAVKQQLDELRTQRNEISQQISAVRKSGGKDTSLEERATRLKGQIAELERKSTDLETGVQAIAITLPNIPHPSVPVSYDESDKVIIRSGGNEREFDFPVTDHLTLCTNLGMLDFKTGAKLSGSQFPLYKGKGASLERALLNFLVDRVTSKGYQLVIPPLLVNERTAFTSGGLPKFRDQLYFCDKDGLFLIPTSEVPLVGMHIDDMLSVDDLPKCYTACTPNFRREAGTYGSKERGLIRVHQFNKVEMFKFVRPETSDSEFEKLVADAESLVRELELPHRTALLPTSDMAQQAAKTVDIEVHIPSQGRYYETSSCSNCGDYQARRGNIRFRDENGKIRFVHTLNGSGLATSRLFASIVENNQTPDGGIKIPEALVKYTGFDTILSE